MNKPKLMLLVGLSGSGKSTIAQKLAEEKWAKYNKTDSKKKAEMLRKEVAELDNRINGLYDLGEYKE
jgi:adenylylsulfate kinase-like enzyme